MLARKAAESAYILDHSGAVLLFHEASLAQELPAATQTPALRHRIAIDDDRRIWSLETGEEPRRSEVAEEDPFCILYTSGTTGRPKGAVLTHFGLIASVLGARQALGLKDGEVTVVSVPLSHVTGVLLGILLMLGVAGRTVLMRAFKARTFLETAALEKMNAYSTAGAAMHLKRGETTSLAGAVAHGAWTFVRTYFLRGGFLDGREGFMLAVSNAEGAYYRYLKQLLLMEARTEVHRQGVKQAVP